MSLFKYARFWLILIILLAALLRLPFLGSWPAGITIDEAGQGYSAFSILKTGKDEWGDFLPVNPRGFGDYKPPVFMYLLVPSIAIFGLTETAVRLPSAVAGILTVLIFFYLVRDLIKSEGAGVLASFLLAISPWHIYYSRLGWESNIGLMFFVLGTCLFIKGMNTGIFLGLSALSLGMAALSYHSFKLLVPLLVLGMILIFWKEVKNLNKKTFITTGAVILIFTLILGYGFIFSGASRRASDQAIIKEENLSDLRKKQFDDQLPQPFNRIFNNKYSFAASKVADNYLGYYSFSFLFGPHRSDGSILNFPSMGLLYIWQLPLILLGIVYLLKNRSKASGIIFLWLLIAPIPASLTQDYMHAGRAQALFPVLTIVSVLGLIYGFDLLKNNKIRKTGAIAFALIVTVSLIVRIDNYLFHTFNRPLGGLKQGYKEVIDFTEREKYKYDKVVFTKVHSEPHAFLGFYTKADPEEFQKAAEDWKKFETDGLRFLDMMDYGAGKYEFRNVDFHRDRNEKNALIVATPEEIPSLVNPKLQINDLSGKTVFVVIDTNELSR